MIKVYAVVLTVAVLALLGWIFTTVLADTNDRPALDPERRFGRTGRRIVAGSVAFGIAGMSAEYSARDISWPVALALASIGAVGAGWYAGRVGSEDPAEPT